MTALVLPSQRKGVCRSALGEVRLARPAAYSQESLGGCAHQETLSLTSTPSIVVFVLLAIILTAGQVVLLMDGNAATRRRWFPWYVVFTTALAVLWFVTMGAWIVSVVVAAVASYWDYVWITGTRFCSRCGVMTPPPNPFFGSDRTRCRCGADLPGPGQPSN